MHRACGGCMSSRVLYPTVGTNSTTPYFSTKHRVSIIEARGARRRARDGCRLSLQALSLFPKLFAESIYFQSVSRCKQQLPRAPPHGRHTLAWPAVSDSVSTRASLSAKAPERHKRTGDRQRPPRACVHLRRESPKARAEVSARTIGSGEISSGGRAAVHVHRCV